MKHKTIISNVITGLIVGFVVVSLNQSNNDEITELQKSSIVSGIKTTSSNVTATTEIPKTDLTFASEKTVETVAHITTEFTKEEITYDPILRLFYGEDAYRKRQRHGTSAGSGVVISQNGYIVTNNHVVQDAHTIHVNIDDKRYSGELIGTDPSTDLAVIKIDEENLSYLEFDNSDNLRLGEWVIAVGNPLNLQTTVTAGIVSAKNRNIDLLTKNFNPEKNVFPVESFIQTDAAVNSGNSGGALVNSDGNLVGINTAIASGNGFYTGYSFAIPSNIVKKVAWDIIQYGEVKRVFLGITIGENNGNISQELGLNTKKGIIVTSVDQEGSAAKANLRYEDIILAIDNEEVNSVSEFQSKLLLKQPGQEITLRILRESSEKLVKIKL